MGHEADVTPVTDADLKRAINAYCGALDGRRVTNLAPLGYSVPMGEKTDGFDYEEWARTRVEAAIETCRKRAKRKPKMDQQLSRLIRHTYWESIEPEDEMHHLALLLFRLALKVELEQNPLPKRAVSS